jgi:multiple antibiotic resistance protein
MEGLIQSFIVFFVSIDPFGIVPTFLTLTNGLSGKLRRKVAIISSFYAFFVAVFFILLGKWLFAYFGISLSHFKIAGGLVLLVLSIRELVIYGEDKGKMGGLGVVPLGIPLIVGPATLSAGISLVEIWGYPITILSLSLNVFITAVMQFLGRGGLTALSKIIMLILSAISVKMIIDGIEEVVRSALKFSQ